ncbi:unnamed protein product [Cladocopium goreaui]|uniref:Uncharacterized protein n=1 Tax=Cladocopium goreaui TaxID=2562237 RepID=A0A9P1FT12_9DINO|nr:unnamed protein product [Cladocopium goreaui]|mmetsp:Transcript_78718/g.160066  ORF Transcript_78718/g.160066 Transcript_78718/m.160066 type:complete len:560 (-) Transcript_78718:19-1698(-)
MDDTGRNDTEDPVPDVLGDGSVHEQVPAFSRGESTKPEAEVLRLKEQVRELQIQLDAKESQNQELMVIVGHVRQQEAARKHAEEKLKMAQEAAEANAAEKDRRYSELFHMVCQVDREVAARRDAEKRMETAAAAARQAVAKASEEALAATARANEAEERAKLTEDARLQLEVRLTEKEAQLAPLRAQLAKASQAASESQILSNSLQEQLAIVVKTSEARAANCADAKARCSRAEQQATFAREEAEVFSARATELEKERDEVNQKLETARKDYGELQKAYDEAGGVLCERFGEANRHKEIVDQLHGDIESMEKEISDLQEQLKAAKADTADWCERAMVAADQLAQGEGKASSTFLRKFPAAQAVVVLFRYMLSQADETLEAAVKQRLFLHGQYLSRHELNQFLTDFAGFRHMDLNVVSQALFGVLDLEREGQVPQDLLMERMLEAPSMKDVWLADLPSLWPGRDTVVQYARRSGAWSLPSPHRLSRSPMSRPRSSRPGSACTAPGAVSRRSSVSALPVPKAPPMKRPSTACTLCRRDQEGLQRKDRRSSAPERQAEVVWA